MELYYSSITRKGYHIYRRHHCCCCAVEGKTLDTYKTCQWIQSYLISRRNCVYEKQTSQEKLHEGIEKVCSKFHFVSPEDGPVSLEEHIEGIPERGHIDIAEVEIPSFLADLINCPDDLL